MAWQIAAMASAVASSSGISTSGCTMKMAITTSASTGRYHSSGWTTEGRRIFEEGMRASIGGLRARRGNRGLNDGRPTLLWRWIALVGRRQLQVPSLVVQVRQHRGGVLARQLAVLCQIDLQHEAQFPDLFGERCGQQVELIALAQPYIGAVAAFAGVDERLHGYIPVRWNGGSRSRKRNRRMTKDVQGKAWLGRCGLRASHLHISGTRIKVGSNVKHTYECLHDAPCPTVHQGASVMSRATPSSRFARPSLALTVLAAAV